MKHRYAVSSEWEPTEYEIVGIKLAVFREPIVLPDFRDENKKSGRLQLLDSLHQKLSKMSETVDFSHTQDLYKCMGIVKQLQKEG